MIGLPKATEFNKRIPKQKFYENINVSSALKRIFIDQIKTIYWRNKISVTTLNISEGKNVKEIEVLEIKLETTKLDERVLKQIDKEIHYHILFMLEYENKYQAWIGYKEATVSGNNAFKVNNYYHTEWMNEELLPLKVEGLNIDMVYESFVRQIAGESLNVKSLGESLRDSVARNEEIQQLQKQITVLKVKMRKEKQLNKQMQLNTEIKKLERELEKLING